MLISQAIEGYQKQDSKLIIVDSGHIIRPSKMVIFICDVASIVRKAQPEKSDADIMQVIAAMLAERTVDQIPGLVEGVSGNTDVFDHYNMLNEFVLQESPVDKKFILLSVNQPLAYACQLMSTHSVIFTDDEATVIVGQMQTSYFGKILKAKDYLAVLNAPIYKFLGRIGEEDTECVPRYITYAAGKGDVARRLEYDYCVDMNGTTLKDIKGAVQI